MIRTPWPAWLAATLGSFAVLEYRAVRLGRHPSLTRFLRRALGLDPRAPWGPAATAAFGAFWMWLVAHLVRQEGACGRSA